MRRASAQGKVEEVCTEKKKINTHEIHRYPPKELAPMRCRHESLFWLLLLLLLLKEREVFTPHAWP
jgi:hypothetical protein